MMWISVHDRLPEKSGGFLVTDGNRVEWRRFHRKRNGIQVWGSSYNLGTVTHWMPIPEPPSLEQEAQ